MYLPRCSNSEIVEKKNDGEMRRGAFTVQFDFVNVLIKLFSYLHYIIVPIKCAVSANVTFTVSENCTNCEFG